VSVIDSSTAKNWAKSLLWLVLAIICFQLAYNHAFPGAGLLILGYACFLVRLTEQPTVRRAFYFGLVTGFLCAGPQLLFFWKIFGPAAIVLWLVFAFWIGLFVALASGCRRRWGNKAMWLIPILWTGLEYFRSELYYLRFSWLNIGYALPPPCDNLGMYSAGFLAMSIAVACHYFRHSKLSPFKTVLIIGSVVVLVSLVIHLRMIFGVALSNYANHRQVAIAGVQMEFPGEGILPEALNHALAKDTNAQIFVLSEYTLDGGVPGSLTNWCREHSRFLVVGGKDVVTNDVYYNTTFVIGTNGAIVFKQAKCVPIQFFHDGLPATTQRVWDSPWGKIGFCICYDLSYTRVTDELVRQGAQLLIVPTMDVEEWGRHEHELHTLVAPVRAAEYCVPIFRLASSGISQAVYGGGKVAARTSLGNPAEVLSATLPLPVQGSLPPDRLLAPICTALTGIIMVILSLLSWRDRRQRPAEKL
jgi:apolipoprotein N-acyltransferase